MHRRAVIIYAAVCFMFAVCLFVIARVQTGTLSDAASKQDTRKQLLGVSRGYIYDRNLHPLVNREQKDISVFLCCDGTKEQVCDIFGKSAFSQGKVLVSDKTCEENGNRTVVGTKIKNRYGERLLCGHVIGYINSDGKGVCGIEKAYDELLDNAKGKLYARYTVDAYGKALPGYGIKIENKNYDSPAGIALTIDENIQKITEDALASSDIKTGAAVVLDCRSFEILAAASVPVYDVNDLSSALGDENSPFVNRCFSAFPVGSVFKPFVAAASMMYRNDLSKKFNCKGFINAGNQQYRCFNGNKHGKETLYEAIANSCNTYFINCGISLGGEKLIEACSAFGFGQSTELFPGLVSSPGNLPESESIVSDAQLANLCFGQGELLATPLQLAAAYSVIANGGEYIEPYILYRMIDENNKISGYYKSEIQRTVLSKEICDYIGNCLYNNILEGTGKNGRPSNTTAAGKTATAQTGSYDENGRERLCTWFAGYFPFDKPLYTVVIFNENGTSAAEDCAPVFKRIAEDIARSF